MTPLESLQAAAQQLGFDWCAVAEASPLEQERAQLEQWLSEGRHGSMEWLARDPARRCDPGLVLEECRTVIVLGMNYLQDEIDTPQNAGAPPPKGSTRISRYARTRDYHRVIEKRLRKLARQLDQDIVPGSVTRCYVDYGPVLERSWAKRVGLGFIGKHTLLIHPKEGSFHFLAVLLTTANIPNSSPPPLPIEGCGDCRRCIDACPTGAITEPWKLDARRCLSYLTIEHAGPIAEEFWPQFQGNLFGCDICQDVCPYNQKRAKQTSDTTPLGSPLVPATLSLVEILENTDQLFNSLNGIASPLLRAGKEQILRNAVIIAAHNGTPDVVPALEKIAENPAYPEWLRESSHTALKRHMEK